MLATKIQPRLAHKLQLQQPRPQTLHETEPQGLREETLRPGAQPHGEANAGGRRIQEIEFHNAEDEAGKSNVCRVL